MVSGLQKKKQLPSVGGAAPPGTFCFFIVVANQKKAKTASKKMRFSTWIVAALVGLASLVQGAYVVNPSGTTGYAASITAPDTTAPRQSCYALVFGVGTAMTSVDYSKLSKQVAGNGHVMVVLDSAPGSLVKTDETKFANALTSVKTKLVGWLKAGGPCESFHFLVGGHSAGGRAALQALINAPSVAVGYVGTDPFDCTTVTGRLSVPSVVWAFSKTTCTVSLEKAGGNCYSDHAKIGSRVLYRVSDTTTPFSWTCLGWVPTYAHCAFTDAGCAGVCPKCGQTPDQFLVDVSTSINTLVSTIKSNSAVSASAFTLIGTTVTPVIISVN